MKTSLATTLSVIGVLATGGVAMAVNTTVLDSTVSSVEGPSPLAEALVPIAAFSVQSTVPINSAMPVLPTTPGETVPSVPEMIVEHASVQSAYDVQGVGIITLEQSATNLSVISVNPVSGWTYDSKNEGASRLEIKFTSGTQLVKFTAELLDGRIITAVEATDTSVAPPRKDDDQPESNDDSGHDSGEGEVDDD